jgi:hypothetical protein
VDNCLPQQAAGKYQPHRNYNAQPTIRRRISVDASPWGIGGILYEHDTPLSYFADNITVHDTTRFAATTGDPAFNTLWEGLAILVALRLWRNNNTSAVTFRVRSDSLTQLSSILKGSSKSPSLNSIVAVILLDEAELYNALLVTTHIPGVTNVQPDALSRLSAPTPSSIPQGLYNIPRVQPPPRDEHFWLTLGGF